MTMDPLTPIDCKDGGPAWVNKLNAHLVAIREYINALETAQKQATYSVSTEVGAARDGAATLLDKIQAMDGLSDELKAQIEALVLGKKADLYDSAASYVKNDFVIYDTSFYVCLSETAITGVAPSDTSKWKLLLGYERAPLPTLAGPLTANEGTTHDISLGASYDANAKYYPTVSGGSLSDLMQFTEGDYAGQWGWKWTMPTLDANAAYNIEVYSTQDGYARSYLATRSVTVIYVPVQDGPTMTFADSAEGYPGATISNGVISAPAHSVGLNNSHQIVSAKPEIVQTSGKLTILNTSTATRLDTKEKPDASNTLLIGQTLKKLSGFTVTENVPTNIQQVPLASMFKYGADRFSASGTTLNLIKSGKAITDAISGDFTFSFTWNGAATNGCAMAALLKPAEAEYQKGQVGSWQFRTNVSTAVAYDEYVSSAESGSTPKMTSWFGQSSQSGFSRSQTFEYKRVGDRITAKVGSVVVATYTYSGDIHIALSGYDGRADYHNVALTKGSTEVTYSTDITPLTLSAPPDRAFEVTPDPLRIGAGTVGEYLGSKKELALKSGSSTKSSIVVTCDESIKDKVLKSGGLHKTILIDDVEVEVESVVETTTPITALTAKRMSGGIALGPVIFKDGFEGAVVVAPGDHRVKKVWGPTGTDVAGMPNIPYASDGDANTGIQNTDILAALSGYEAAKYCKSFNFEGHSDYFLANINMMKFICDNHELIDAVDTSTANKFASLAGDYLWSSTEQHPDRAHRMRPDSYTDGQTKTIAHWVVPCRRISTGEFGSVVTSTITPKTALSKVPTTVAIPDRCTLSPAGYTYAIDGDDLKITGAEITLEDNPVLKRLAMAVSEDGLIFKAGKIYIKEKP